jgi:aryl-alcohol dehydrogenase-like predicted oxidoreductase
MNATAWPASAVRSSSASTFDTADEHGPFTNETLVGKALQGIARESVKVATN